MGQLFCAIGCALSGLSVVLGAFGAHGLKNTLSDNALQTFEVSVRYQMYHSLGLILIGLFVHTWPSNLFHIAGWCLLVGLLFFCGSLYGLALGGPKLLGPITPIGGLLWVVGWGVAAFAIWKQPLS